MKTHVRLLRTMGACSESIVFAKKYPSLTAAWKHCERGDWLLWFISRAVKAEWGTPEHRKIVGVACRCARLSEKLWTDKRSIAAVVLAERYAAGEQISRNDLAAAWSAVTKQCAGIVRETYSLPPKARAK